MDKNSTSAGMIALKVFVLFRRANEFISNGFLMLIYAFVFPVYVYIYRKNRDKERTTNVYPIINHFYNATWVNYIVFSLGLISRGIFLYVYEYYPKSFYICDRIMTIYNDYFAVFFKVHHLVLSLLAIQRFFLYFFPMVEKYINFKGKNVIRIVYGVYIIFYSKTSTIYVVYFFIWKVQGVHDFFLNMSWVSVGLNAIDILILQFDELVTHGLLLFSTLLYIPIVVSIRRNSHLASIKKSRPHQYILSQSMLIFIVKSASICNFVAYSIFKYGNIVINMDVVLYLQFTSLLSTPVLVQVSYLMCKKKNLDMLRKSLSFRKLINNCLFCLFRTHQVEPTSVRHETQTNFIL